MESGKSMIDRGGVAPRPISPSQQWWAVVVTMVFNIMSLVDRSMISLLIPEMKRDLGINDFEAGIVQGLSFALFYGFMGMIIGGYIDRFSRRRIMYLGVTMWSVAATFTGLAQNFVQMFLARIWVGVGEGAISPAAQSLLASLFPRDRLATPISCFIGAGTIGIGVSFALGGWLLDTLTVHPLAIFGGMAPWRQVIVVSGLPGLVIALLAFTLVEPRGTRAVQYNAATWTEFWRFIRRDWRVLGGLLGGLALSGTMINSVFTWAPTVARQMLNLSATSTGLSIGTIIAVGGVVCALVMGVIVDRWFSRGRRDAVLLCWLYAIAISVPISATGFLSGNVTMLFVGLAAIYLVAGCFGPVFAALQIVTPEAMRGRVAALAVLIANLFGIGLGPIIVGAITDYVYGDPHAVGRSVATVVLILGPVTFLIVLLTRGAYRRRLDELSQEAHAVGPPAPSDKSTPAALSAKRMPI